MPIPQNVLLIDDEWNLCNRVSELASSYLKNETGKEFNVEEWWQCKNKNDFYLALLGYFMGTWENSGSFIHQISAWNEFEIQVLEMLHHFSCFKTAQAFTSGKDLLKRMNHHLLNSHDEYPREMLDEQAWYNKSTGLECSCLHFAQCIRKNKNIYLLKCT